MRSIALLVLILALLALSCPAQTPATNIYAGGVSYNPGASPAIAGTGLYARLVAGTGTYAFTVVDLLPTTLAPFTVTSNMAVGIAQKVVQINSVSVYIPTAAGISYTGSNTGWAWSTGALASVPIKGAWKIQPNVRFLKSSVNNGSGYQVIGGVLFGWGR